MNTFLPEGVKSQVCNYNNIKHFQDLTVNSAFSVLASGQTKQEGRHGKLRDIGWDLAGTW